MHRISIRNNQHGTMFKYIHVMGILLILSTVVTISARDYIQSFHSDITIHTDASLTVTETIAYTNVDEHSKHGIVRHIPIEYIGPYGTNYSVSFSINHIHKDGNPVAYHVQQQEDNCVVYIGSRDQHIATGNHTYTISYTTYRQIGFFQGHDELYWNITGTEWRLPIHHVSATVHLPEEVPHDHIKAHAYTGYFLGEDYQTSVTDINPNDTSVTITSSQQLPPGQGVTIAIQWPKGYVQEHTWFDEARYFAHDNWNTLAGALCLCLLAVYYIIMHYRVRNREHRDTIIPQFHPPDISPGAMDYIVSTQYNPRQLSAELVNMAVHKQITIEGKQKAFGSGLIYILHNINDDTRNPPFEAHNVILQHIFKNKNYTIPDQENDRMQRTARALQARYQRLYNTYFLHNVHISIIYPALCLLPMYIILTALQPNIPGTFHPSTSNVLDIILPWIVMALIIYNTYALRSYTDAGVQIRNQILGFKMFLEATEQHRIEILGTPPTKTPELHDTYLPYAIALGVEQKWSSQFSHIFKATTYQPHWYRGHIPYSGVHQFSSDLKRSLRSSISTRGTGLSGAGIGSPGGGRGGGGGGSW